MGKFKTNLTDFLLSRPRMFQYNRLSREKKDFIDSVVLEYSKPNNELRLWKFWKHKVREPKVESFWNLTWEEVILLRKHISGNKLFEVLELIYGITEKQFLKLEITNVFSVYKWINEQMKILQNAEIERLSSEITDEEKMAGVEELQEYDYYVPLRIMCPDMTKHNEYLKMPYSIIFREMACSKLVNDINKKIQEYVNRKNKRNR